MRTFKLNRIRDNGKVSGQGHCLTGIEFDCGKVVVCWETKNTDIHNIEIFDNYNQFLQIHCYQHLNISEVVFSDGTIEQYD